jgi:RNA polymerase-interacting CarD/CdnL/TRCF family regulator
MSRINSLVEDWQSRSRESRRTKMEPGAISKHEKWANKQILVRNKRMAAIMDQLRDRVPASLAMTIKRTRVIEELFTSGNITITASLERKLECELQVENFDQLEASVNELKNAWEGVVRIWCQRLDEEGIMNICFDAL